MRYAVRLVLLLAAVVLIAPLAARASTIPVGAGSGLKGLRDRVEALRGRFDVESRPGCGTTLRAVWEFITTIRRQWKPAAASCA